MRRLSGRRACGWGEATDEPGATRPSGSRGRSPHQARQNCGCVRESTAKLSLEQRVTKQTKTEGFGGFNFVGFVNFCKSEVPRSDKAQVRCASNFSLGGGGETRLAVQVASNPGTIHENHHPIYSH